MSRSKSHPLARRFVRRVVRDVFGDFLDLIERERTAHSYKAIEESVRRQSEVPTHDLLMLEETVRETVPEPYRGNLVSALNALSNAFTDELVVRERTAYLVGLAVGQTFSTTMLPDALQERLET